MKIQIRVVPGSSQERVMRRTPGTYTVWVKAQPEKGKATKAVQKLLAQYFKVHMRNVLLLQTTSRVKWADITV